MKTTTLWAGVGRGRGGALPYMGYIDMCRRIRVGFLRFSIPRGIVFAPVNNVFPALSLDRVPKLYQLKLQCKNA